MKSKNILTLIFFAVLLTGCSRPVAKNVSMFPPANFQETDLLGNWRTTNDPHSIETLSLNADHTYLQTFNLNDSEYSFQANGTWKTVSKQTGCVYIHLSGMRFYYQVFEIAENGNKLPNGHPESYWDPCGENIIQMVDETVLIVSSHPDSSNGIVLRHVTTQKDGLNVVFDYSENK
jgi:hypothetical protein